MSNANATKPTINARQIAFFAAFILPTYKLVELPSLLARFAAGDLLIPALLQFLLQTCTLALLLYGVSLLKKPLFQLLEARLGCWVRVVYGVYGVVFMLAAVLPLLDLEKFVYSIFYDTAPTLFSFAAFFLFSAFLCKKSTRAQGRMGDLSLFLFLIPFLALLVMSVVEADITNLLPLFEKDFSSSFAAVPYSAPHFIDVLLLLPLIGNLSFEKGDGVKITMGYAVGALFTLAFLALFYGVFSSVAARNHYAFAKIAQYFPVLAIVGRIDLLFVYLVCIVLFFYVATPLQNATACLQKTSGAHGKTLLSILINLAAFLFTLFCNRFYDSIYALFGKFGYPVFWLFGNVLPLVFILLLAAKKENRYA